MTITEIQTLVCETWRVTRCDLLSNRRDQRSVRPRHAAMWLARHATPASLAAIGRAFGHRDHTTVRHALDCVEMWLARDAAYAAVVWRLMAEIDPAASVELRRIRMREQAA